MVRKLELVGIILVAAGLAALAYADPLVRILIFGTGGFNPTGTGARPQFFNSTGTTGGTLSRATFTGIGTTELVASLSAFGASVVGLVLIITSMLTRERAGGKA